jgi:uncharacterized protein YjgD (DUF1641 family)
MDEMTALHDKIDYLTAQVNQLSQQLTAQEQRQHGFEELQHEFYPIANKMFAEAIVQFDHLEKQGYFAFGNGLGYIMERIVTEFDEADVRALGDNIVTILSTVRHMTQPETLAVANKAVEAMQAEPLTADVSTWALLRELSDPKVRRGMARMINLLKAMADQPQVVNSN